MGYYDALNEENPVIDASQLTPEAEAKRAQLSGSIDTGGTANVGNAGSIQIDTGENHPASGVTISGAPSGMTPGIENQAAAPAANANPWGTTYDVAGLSDWMKTQRQGDMKEGLDYGKNFFGAGNPQMKEILDTKRSRAMGLNGAEIQALRENATSGINQTMATGLRQNAGILARNGVHGGAAVGANSSVLARANTDRANAERDIGIEDMRRRGQALDDYEHTVTGERAGLMGTAASFADMGAGERSSALQYGLGKDNEAAYSGAANANPDFGDSSWNIKDAMNKWKESGYNPNDTPWSEWLHKNVFDKKDIGIDPEKWTTDAGININKYI